MTNLRLFITKIAVLAICSTRLFADPFVTSPEVTEIYTLIAVAQEHLQSYPTPGDRRTFLTTVIDLLQDRNKSTFERLDNALQFIGVSQNNRLWKLIGEEVIHDYIRVGNIRATSEAFMYLRDSEENESQHRFYTEALKTMIGRIDLAISRDEMADAQYAARNLVYKLFTDPSTGRYRAFEGIGNILEIFYWYKVEYNTGVNTMVLVLEQYLMLVDNPSDWFQLRMNLAEPENFSSTNVMMTVIGRPTLQEWEATRPRGFDAFSSGLSRMCRGMFK